MVEKKKPLLVYDGDCGFCKKWIFYWQGTHKDDFDAAPFQEAASQFPEIPKENFEKSIQLVEPGSVGSRHVRQGADAIFSALHHRGIYRLLHWCYQFVPGFKGISEWFYQLVAKRRTFFSGLTTALWGKSLIQPVYFLTRWLFLRSLAVIYLIAFASLGSQIIGLIGSEGILPAADYLDFITSRIGLERFWILPTLGWINTSDFFLQSLCWAGIVFSLLATLNIFPILTFAACWILYLSLFGLGQSFLSFQWDVLLLEVGFLAIFFSPFGIVPKPSQATPPSKFIHFLYKLLLFRLMFSSGASKLLSGDETWRNLTALNFHYETQPLPTWIGWFAHQLPVWFQKLSVLGMFVIELGIPFMIFLPRRMRVLAYFAFSILMTLIILTGNYTYFNILTLTLCVLIVDDAFFRKFKLFEFMGSKIQAAKKGWPKVIILPVGIFLLLLSLINFSVSAVIRIPWPKPLLAAYSFVQPLHLVGGYGLFAMMTTQRNEIIMEGSQDGKNWLPYEFPHKPGDLRRRPTTAAPFQPRLDWQMWFAALSNYRRNPWILNLTVRLLKGSEPVLKLFESNPFPKNPPKYIRASIYNYQFTNFATRKETGQWWKRSFKGAYLPPISLEDVKSEAYSVHY